MLFTAGQHREKNQERRLRIPLIYLIIISKALPSTLYSGIDVEQGINIRSRKLEMFPNE